MPDTPDYLKRISDHVDGKDAMELQARAADVLESLLAGATDEELRARPGADKWSIGEILAHLAEDEMATAWRYRQMVEHSGVPLPGFDQDLWAQWGDYGARSPHQSLALFRLLREANLQFLKKLSEVQWGCYGIHAERGRITIRELATHMAGHDANHMAQIRAILNHDADGDRRILQV